jgi:mRNA interferase MazF
LTPGDIVAGAFPGADTTKMRPAVVLSTELYRHWRPDVVLGLLTTQTPNRPGPTDCAIREWRRAGLHQPSFFRLYVVTLLQRDVRLLGRLSEGDWNSVRACFAAGFGARIAG